MLALESTVFVWFVSVEVAVEEEADLSDCVEGLELVISGDLMI